MPRVERICFGYSPRPELPRRAQQLLCAMKNQHGPDDLPYLSFGVLPPLSRHPCPLRTKPPHPITLPHQPPVKETRQDLCKHITRALSPRVARGQVELQVEPFGATALPDGTVRNGRLERNRDSLSAPTDPPPPPKPTMTATDLIQAYNAWARNDLDVTPTQTSDAYDPTADRLPASEDSEAGQRAQSTAITHFAGRPIQHTQATGSTTDLLITLQIALDPPLHLHSRPLGLG